MVEATQNGTDGNWEGEGERQLKVNIDQMVHIKAFQTGYLTFDKKFVNVPGYVYGSSKHLQTYTDGSSFLPFTAVNRESYGPGQTF